MIFIIGANLDFANTKLQLILSLLFIYIIAWCPFFKLSANMCHFIGSAEKHLHHPSIWTMSIV